MSPALRHIPSTERLLADPEVAGLARSLGREPVRAAVRAACAELRAALRAGAPPPEDPTAEIRTAVRRRLATAGAPSLRPAINATGVVLHTGLGRAVLPAAAAEAIAATAAGHALLEAEPETGERGSRQVHVAPLLRELTGAEDGLVVNNNAAAVYLTVAALAAGREVVISRGQLVEIGGGFRIPDVLRSAGARLVEVGTTNRTRLSDYAAALGPETALILRVHPSNFRVIGFTEEPEPAALAALARDHGVPLVDDLGSGALVDLRPYGLAQEPLVQASVAAGADLVTFSGDKLLGGPQAGFVVGGMELLARLQRHPLMRVVRVDKLTLAGIEATLRLYRDPARAMREVPTLAALAEAPAALRARAERLAGLLALPGPAGPAGLEVTLEPGVSQVGGGSLPGEELPTTLVCLACGEPDVAELARRLRTGTPSVWGRIRRDRLLLDPRTVRDAEVEPLAAAVRAALG